MSANAALWDFTFQTLEDDGGDDDDDDAFVIMVFRNYFAPSFAFLDAFLFSVPRCPCDDFHWFWLSDDIPEEVGFIKLFHFHFHHLH